MRLMADIQYPPARPLSVGETLDLAVRIYRRTLVKCLVLSGLGVLGSELATVYNLARHRYLVQGLNAWRDPWFDLLYVLGLVLSSVLFGAVLLRQHALVTRHACGGEIVAALRRLPAYLGMFLFLSFTVGLPFIVLGMGMLPLTVALVYLVLLVGFFGVMLSCAWPLLFIKGTGPLQSLTRSWALTRGSYWRLTALYSVGLLILLALWMVFGIVSVSLGVVLGRGDVLVATATASLLAVLGAALLFPFYTALSLAVLGDLTVRREGADLEQRIAATA